MFAFLLHVIVYCQSKVFDMIHLFYDGVVDDGWMVVCVSRKKHFLCFIKILVRMFLFAPLFKLHS